MALVRGVEVFCQKPLMSLLFSRRDLNARDHHISYAHAWNHVELRMPAVCSASPRIQSAVGGLHELKVIKSGNSTRNKNTP